MRCKSCDKIMDELDLSQPIQSNGEHEDLCRRCKSVVHQTLSEQEPSDWELFTEVPVLDIPPDSFEREDFDDLDSY